MIDLPLGADTSDGVLANPEVAARGPGDPRCHLLWHHHFIPVPPNPCP